MNKGAAVGIGIGCVVLLLIGLVCAGLFGGLAWLGFDMYKDTTGAADAFLGKLGGGDIAGAYQSGATALQQQQTLEEFTAQAKALGLTEYQSAAWTGFNIVNDQGTVDGTMTTKTGGSVPIKVSLIKEGGTWKVSGVTSPVAGVGAAQPAGGPLPSDAELQKLARTSLLDFNRSVQSGDFKAFYGTLADRWKRETTPQKLEEAFADFVEKKIDLAPIAKEKAAFTGEPAVGANGNLVLEGYYPTKPLKVTFTLKYTYEGQAWKLIGISVKTEE